VTPSPGIIIVADDLTGAADAAGGIASRGLATLLPFTSSVPAACDALAFTTDSRDLSADEAVRRVRALISELRREDVLSYATVIYKKVDSTLRGHPGAELAALMDEAGLNRCLVAPAFPAQGRTTVNGRQLVGGVPLEHTDFAREVETSDLGAAFATREMTQVFLGLPDVRGGRLEGFLAQPGPRLLIADAETDEDLNRLARAAVGGLRLFCGSAGLISALVTAGDRQAPVIRRELPPIRRGPGLIVAGSRHPRTRAQVGHLRASGTPVLELGVGAAVRRTQPTELAERAGDFLNGGRDVVLAADAGGSGPNTPEVARALAELCREIVRRSPPASLVLTGGETAGAVCRELRVSALRVLGEVFPGIPHGRMLKGLLPDLPFATKAGGFGDSDALWSALRFLSGRRSERTA
jgi:D-threonate/D-erythronate kinase